MADASAVFIEDVEPHNDEILSKKINNQDFPAMDGSIENCVIDGISPLKSDDESGLSKTMLDLFIDEAGNVKVHQVLGELKKGGIRPFSDIRLERMMNKLSVDSEGLVINSEIGIRKLVPEAEFRAASRDAAEILNSVLCSKLIIPDWKGFCQIMTDIYRDLLKVEGGKNATYIPQLSRTNPHLLGISVCTVDGQRFSVGDTDIPFCIQSCSKALTYAINVTQHGPEFVHKHVGKEPSGTGFNEISLDKNGVPHNPMVNPGGISCVSLVDGKLSMSEKFDYVTAEYRRMAGEEFIGFSNGTFLSEKSCADRNFAIGYYMKEHGVFPENSNLHESLDLYFQLCSVEATADSLAVIAATLANGGVCPTSGDECVTPDAVRNTLSLMFSCGMYDYSGEWSFEVGVPAKSGVAGSIMLVIPGVMGISVWSPPLDELGNSYRGIVFAKKLVEKFNFHQFDTVMGGLKKIDPTLRGSRENREIVINNLLTAAVSADMVLLKRYLEMGVDFNLSDYDQRTALHLAVCNGHMTIVKLLLLRAKVNVNPIDRWSSTPLDDAIRYDMDDIRNYLEKKGAMLGKELKLQETMQE